MKGIEILARNARVTVRCQGESDPMGSCVDYWMQRAHRALDKPALNLALGGERVAQARFGLVPFYPNANPRHYEFLIQGFQSIARGLE